ncbi:MAG: DUF1501 domain-containing protein, partial [Bacteroidales bacterium]|nr:DUF1501 domain-containing protein [Bacteroidales bacterium]
TPIYVVNHGGFDTHANQVTEGETELGKHADLMRYVSEAVYAFQDELKQHQKEDDVISLVYSEFGRRIASNKSFGTDHGEAYPMMLFGSRVNPIVFGENPTIPASVEKKTNVPFKIDFRSVYASVLNLWFGVNKTEINNLLLGEFEILPILKNAVSVDDNINKPNQLKIMSVFPNPVINSAEIQFVTNGGQISLRLFSLAGKEIRNLRDGNLPGGIQSIPFTKKGLNSGQYLLVLQNGAERVSQKIIIQ